RERRPRLDDEERGDRREGHEDEDAGPVREAGEHASGDVRAGRPGRGDGALRGARPRGTGDGHCLLRGCRGQVVDGGEPGAGGASPRPRPATGQPWTVIPSRAASTSARSSSEIGAEPATAGSAARAWPSSLATYD